MKNQIKEQKLEATVYNSFLRHESRMERRAMSGALVDMPWLSYTESHTRIDEVARMMVHALYENYEIKTNINIKHDRGYFNDTFMANTKEWFEDISGEFTKYLIFNEAFSLLIFEDEKGNIVLDQIRVVEKNQGLGTKIIDTLLNICDDYNWTCVTVPTAIQEEGDDVLAMQLGMVGVYNHTINRTKRLRNFYTDLGFMSSPFTAKMIYKP